MNCWFRCHGEVLGYEVKLEVNLVGVALTGLGAYAMFRVGRLVKEWLEMDKDIE